MAEFSKTKEFGFKQDIQHVKTEVLWEFLKNECGVSDKEVLRLNWDAMIDDIKKHVTGLSDSEVDALRKKYNVKEQ